MPNMDHEAVMLREEVNYHPVPRGSICYFWNTVWSGKVEPQGQSGKL